MKISNSKKELARIINENGGWRYGEFAAQDGDGTGSIDFFKSKPQYYPNSKFWRGVYDPSERVERADVTIKNFHQTILSRDEYFHLYQAPDADAGSFSAALDLVTDENKHEHVGSKPTIEQLAADYRNAKDYADRKQQEADDAKADAEVKLKALEIAGEALGLVLSVATPEPELVITDWRDLKVGDEIEYLDASCSFAGLVGTVELIDYDDREHYHILFRHGDRGASDNPVEWMSTRWCSEFRFIRRP